MFCLCQKVPITPTVYESFNIWHKNVQEGVSAFLIGIVSLSYSWMNWMHQMDDYLNLLKNRDAVSAGCLPDAV